MITFNIELARTIARDRERVLRDHTRTRNARQTKSRKQVLPRLPWLRTHRVRPAV
jgi:hypothetical protein